MAQRLIERGNILGLHQRIQTVRHVAVKPAGQEA